MRRSILGFALVLAVLFAVPALAAGNSPSKIVYSTSGAKVQGLVAKSTKPSTQAVKGAKAGGTLPFTGLDLSLMFGAAIVLGATGLSLRWLTRKRSDS
jgi:hypothetical protein